MEIISYPTTRHKKFSEHAFEYCQYHNLGMGIKGSLAFGTPMKFSDIDIIIWGPLTDHDMISLVKGFEFPIMTNLSVNPIGILIAVYKNGICIDFDFRNSMLQNEVSVIKILTSSSTIQINDRISRINIPDSLHSVQDDNSNTLRILHRAILK